MGGACVIHGGSHDVLEIYPTVDCYGLSYVIFPFRVFDIKNLCGDFYSCFWFAKLNFFIHITTIYQVKFYIKLFKPRNSLGPRKCCQQSYFVYNLYVTLLLLFSFTLQT